VALRRAAREILETEGLEALSLRSVARKAGVSHAAPYRHFESKDDLVSQTFEHNYTSFARELESLAAREQTAKQKVGAMIRGFCRAHDDNPTRFNFLVFVQHGQLSKLSREAPTPVTVMRAVLARAIEQSEIPPQDPDLATALVLGAVLQPATFAAYGRIALKLEPVSDRLVAAAWAAVNSVVKN